MFLPYELYRREVFRQWAVDKGLLRGLLKHVLDDQKMFRFIHYVLVVDLSEAALWLHWLGRSAEAQALLGFGGGGSDASDGSPPSFVPSPAAMLTLEDENISRHVDENAKTVAPLFSPRGATASDCPAAQWPGDAMFWRVKLEMLLVAPTARLLPADELKASLPSPEAMEVNEDWRDRGEKL